MKVAGTRVIGGASGRRLALACVAASRESCELLAAAAAVCLHRCSIQASRCCSHPRQRPIVPPQATCAAVTSHRIVRSLASPSTLEAHPSNSSIAPALPACRLRLPTAIAGVSGALLVSSHRTPRCAAAQLNQSRPLHSTEPADAPLLLSPSTDSRSFLLLPPSAALFRLPAGLKSQVPVPVPVPARRSTARTATSSSSPAQPVQSFLL